MKKKTPVNIMTKKDWIIIAIGAFIIGLALFLIAGNANAWKKAPNDKVNICHCVKEHCRTLSVDSNGARGHLRNHDRDYKGECRREPTPTPEVTPEPTPVVPVRNTNGGSDGRSSDPGATKAPVCPNGDTTTLVANFHVVRNGDSALVNFFITEGDSANIYYKVNGQDGWQHSLIDVKPNAEGFVGIVINELDPNLGYTFGVQQKTGCGSGEIATSVVVDPPANNKIFTFSFWTW
jgi:hypothetical protein